MLEFDTAQSRLAAAGRAPDAVQACPLAQAAGRVLARDVAAAHDSPPADNSAMDGYAIRHADYAPGRALPVQQRCYAGELPQPLAPGRATRLFTGSLIPAGADTVVMQEDCREADGQVEILSAPEPGRHIRRRGEDIAAGSLLLPAGQRLGAAQIAVLASQGLAEAPVFPLLKVGILTTGDELVEPGGPRADQQIYNSNAAMLRALAAGMGALPAHVLHARDEPQALREAFSTLLADCDLVISVGGVSVGERDLVKAALEEMGGEVALWKVRMKPGKPVALAHVGGKPVVCLPGNPVSAFAVFLLLVTPLARAMQGRSEVLPPTARAVLRTPRTHQDSREEFLRVQLRPGVDGGLEALPFDRQGSGVMSSLPWAQALARIPPDTPLHDGDPVRCYEFAYWLA